MLAKSFRLLRLGVIFFVSLFIFLFLILLVLPKKTNSNRSEEIYKNYSSKDKSVAKSMIDNLSTIVETVGIDGAFHVLDMGMNEQKINRRECHGITHLLGHQAYSRKLSNIPSLLKKYGHQCQSGFPHGIEAQITLEESNISSRNARLKEFCSLYKSTFTIAACYHGAGHAFYQAIKDPKQGVALCDTLGDADLETCYQGVFAEFANEIIGIDTETGLAMPGFKKEITNPQRPLLYCDQYDDKYKDACFFTFTVLVTYQKNGTDDFSPCLYSEYASEMKSLCVEYLAAVTSRDSLEHDVSFVVPNTVSKLPIILQEAYVKGLLGIINAYLRDGQVKDWRSICNSMPQKSVDYCLNTIEQRIHKNL